MTTGIAILGCGYVADLYVNTLDRWSDVLSLKGVWDQDSVRLVGFANHYQFPGYESFQVMLEDSSVDIVVNLTNPCAHYETSKAILESGKHVYVEKPLAMDLDEARTLVALARSKGLEIGCAPSSVLGEPAQTLWKAVREKVAGQPRLVYASIDDGMVHQLGYSNWVSSCGTAWPAEDEFRVGCTMEHAGYTVTWLVAMFGPVVKMVSDASLRVPDKGRHTPANYTTPDFACTTLTFDSGMVACILFSIVADHDHRLRIFCDDGVLSVEEVWNFNERIKFTPMPIERWQRALRKLFRFSRSRRLPSVRKVSVKGTAKGFPMDFCVGLVDMAEALKDTDRRPRMNHDFGLHITEVSLAIQHPEKFGHVYHPVSQFEAMEPMEWAV